MREQELNRSLLDEYKHFIDTRTLSYEDRSKADAQRTSNKVKDGYAKRYPELADDEYIQSMRTTLPKIEPLLEDRQSLLTGALSTNTNVVKIEPEQESLLNNVLSNDELLARL